MKWQVENQAAPCHFVRRQVPSEGVESVDLHVHQQCVRIRIASDWDLGGARRSAEAPRRRIAQRAGSAP